MSKKIIAFFLVCGLIVATGCGKKNNDDNQPSNKDNQEITGPIGNTNESIIEEQIIDGIKFTNITLVSENGNTVFTADVVNTTESAIDLKSFNIIYKDQDGKEIVTLFVYVGKNLEPNGISSISASVDIDLSNATTVEYVRN